MRAGLVGGPEVRVRRAVRERVRPMVSVLVAGVAFLFVFSLVVVVHELGHFTAARRFGVTVEAFSIGFGRTLASWTDKKGTVWRIAAIPLGGYVKFLGDAGAASNPDEARLSALREQLESEHGAGAIAGVFHFKPLWQRAIVVAAGPVANFILAFAIFTAVIAVFGERGYRPVIAEVVVGSPAETAGFLPGDLIVSVDGRPITFFHELKQRVALSSGDATRFDVERDGARASLSAVLGRQAMPDGMGRTVAQGYLGVSVSQTETTWLVQRHGVFGALARGGAWTWNAVEAPARYVGRIFSGRESGDQLGGVLRIATMSGKAAELGYEAGAESGGMAAGLGSAIVSLLMLAGALSVGIGLINLLPVPVLDGGHLVYYGYEAVAGRPLGEGAQEWGFRVGLALVLAMMAFAFWNDLRYLGVFDGLGKALS